MDSSSCPPGVLCVSFSLVVFFLVLASMVLYFVIAKRRELQEPTSSTPSPSKSRSLSKRVSNSNSNSNSQHSLRIEIVAPPYSSDVSQVQKTELLRAVGREINFPTRGPPPELTQIGILTNETSSLILPLFGRQTYNGSSMWNYFTSTDKFQTIRLPVHFKKRNCTNDQCDQTYDDDRVHVPAYGSEEFKVTLYNLDAPRYIPFVY